MCKVLFANFQRENESKLGAVHRVTRLGEFSHTFWVIVYFGHFFKIFKRSPNVGTYGLLFFYGKSCVFNLTKNGLGYRVARWFVFKPKNPIWVNFGWSCNIKSWYILRAFGLFYCHWKYFMAIRYIL
jgi:hypothetical protein